METLDGYLYRIAQAIDGVADIQSHFLEEELSTDSRPAMATCNELLLRVRDDLLNIANWYVTAELEGI